jgi:general secretion pathway protein H
MAAKVVRAMPRKYPASNTDPALIADRTAGFTLIEIQAVMMIIALIAALVFTALPGTGQAQLKALALQTAALLRRERLAAILTGRSQMVFIDGELRAFVTDGGDRVAIPCDVTVDILGVDEQWSGRQAVVRFLPDGTSSGTVMKLSREQATDEIRVNWYTGSVVIEE